MEGMPLCLGKKNRGERTRDLGKLKTNGKKKVYRG